jgi:hypothetical protein
VDERSIGKNRSVIDFEAVFEHGDIPESVWRVQVKRYQGKQVGWNEVSQFADHAGDADLCFVSVFGFDEEATEKADSAGILLLQAQHFSDFILKGSLRESLSIKLSIPS